MMDYKDNIKLMEGVLKFARDNSRDPSTQTAAMIIRDNEILVLESNNFPDYVKESSERWTRPLKYSFVEHAERKAIYNCAKHGYPTKGTTMICSWSPCADCARAIAESGIEKVIWLKEETIPHWEDSLNIGRQILYESGVITEELNHHYGVSLRRNGQMVNL